MTLIYEEAEDREKALLQAATRWIESGENTESLVLGPRGVTGQGTPTVELRVLYAETLELESEWTVPDHADPSNRI